MKKTSGAPKVLVPGLLAAAAALALATSAGAQTPPPSTTNTTTTKTTETSSRTGHHRTHAKEAPQDAAMKAECEAMMAKSQESQEKLEAMDATLDKLVAEMNAAKESKEPDAMEKPMAAVINELVLQRKAMRSMMQEAQPRTMAHMMGHMRMHGAKGAMECPMMKHMDEKKAAM